MKKQWGNLMEIEKKKRGNNKENSKINEIRKNNENN